MRSRTWLNALFWLLWAGSGATWISLTWPHNLESRISLLVAVAAFWINFYPRFVQGSRLVCTANQVTILGITAGNQLPILIEIAVTDLLAEQPSPAATQLMANVPGLRRVVEEKSIKDLTAWFQQNPPRQGLYVPPDNLICRFLQDNRTTPAFFIPLFVYNAGARHAEIGCVLMVAELTSDPTRKWAYAAYFELDESKLIHINQRMHDLDKLSAFFAGHTIAPNDSIKLNLYFTPHHDVLGVKVSSTSLPPGIYNLRITGLDPHGRQAFNTVITDYPLAEDTLLMSFKNGQWTFHAGVDRGILKAMKRAR
jgi:hypothetical protein